MRTNPIRRNWNIRLLQSLVIMLVSVCAVRAEEPIKGAFGQTLGATFDPGNATRTLSDSRFLSFWYAQLSGLPVLSEFSVLVSPMTYRIYMIVAEGKAGSLNACLESSNSLFALIAGKYYGKTYDATMSEYTDHRGWFLDQPKTSRRIRVTCDANGELLARYEDTALKTTADGEQREFNQLNADYTAGNYSGILPRVRALAEQGHLWAETLLGLMYRKGQGVVHDDDKAEDFYGRAAKKGWPGAEYNLGTYYKTEFRFREAEFWLLKAAEQGQYEADLNLAQIYHAPGTLHDEEKSFLWLLRGAEHGDATAQYNTCWDYADGVGVTRNMEEAYRWCYIAAQQGQPQAIRNRDHLASQMQPMEVARARAAAEKWLGQHGNSK